MTTTTIPYSKLILSDTNVRKSNGEVGITALAASIAEHGLLQPLIVSPTTPKKAKYEVHAGGRRWRAIGALIEAGQLPKDHPVEVKVFDNESAATREISLAENLQREPMTPADECLAYRDILAEGANPEDIARRFGVTVRHVQGRLRLADLAEPIFDALRNGEITLDIAMAYGSVADHTRQIAAWERCSKTWASDNPQQIRRILSEEALSSQSALALLVGEDSYLAAGGRVERDLFSQDRQGTWTDTAIAQTLALQKMEFEADVAKLGSKLGWVTPILAARPAHEETKDLRSYYPQHTEPSEEARARMAEIENQIADLDVQMECVEDEDEIDRIADQRDALSNEYDRLGDTETIIPEEDRAHVGTFLVVDHTGQPTLWHQLYTTATAKPARPTNPAHGPDANGNSPVPDDDEDDGNAIDQLSRTLEEQLAKDRRDVLSLHLAHDPALALDLTIFSLAREYAGHFGYNDTGCSIKVTDRFEPTGLKDIPASPALEGLESIRSMLPSDWATHQDSFTSFIAFRALDDEIRAAWLAYAVSQSLKASLADGPHSNAFQSSLGSMIGIDIAQHWRPGAESFFDRIKKGQILKILGEIDPSMPGRYATAKKSELASAATKLCSGDAIVEPAIKERALTWIPTQMAFGSNVSNPPADTGDITCDNLTADQHEDAALEEGDDTFCDDDEADPDQLPEAA